MTPLSSILRPASIVEIVGQTHLLGDGKPISQMAHKKRAINTILWGPSGCGKTTIVRALAKELDANFIALNATDATVKDIRNCINNAKKEDRTTFVFVDEIHRFSKSQQDVILPAIEEGIFTLFGATTENPKFAVNSTILSRCIVLEVSNLDASESIQLILRVKEHYKAKQRTIKIDSDAAKTLIQRANGDARKIIVILETCIEILSDDDHITLELVNMACPGKHVHFDATGNEHFDFAHCYQTAIQNSDTDSAIYWLARWLSSGEDPAYISRRMLITSFEDCASNPNAWLAALAATFAVERTGLPECMIPMALATCEMGYSQRNRSAYEAIKSAMRDVENNITAKVPDVLRAGSSGYTKIIDKVYVNNFR